MKKFSLFLGDILILYSALFLTLFARYGGNFNSSLDAHLEPFSAVFVIWVLVFYILNLYELSFTKNNLPFFSALLYGIAVNSVISLFFFYFVPFFGIAPKRNLLIFLGISFILLNIWRRYFNRVIATGNLNNNTLIVGANKQANELSEFLKTNPQLGYNALGVLDTADPNAIAVFKDLIIEKNIKTVILSPESYQIPRIIDVLYRLLGFGINFYSLPDFYESTTGRIPLGAIDQVWFLENLSERSKRAFELIKRFFDIIFSIIIGTVVAILYPFIVLAIKADSPGPAVYKQKRVGKAGQIFTLVKFRTMFTDAEAGSGAVWAKIDDPRITKFGKFLRRTRLDELPQVLNVLKGEMSFVGPRPERPEFHDKLKSEIPFYEERYLIKPGLTGWAQIRYKLDFQGMTIQDTIQKLQYDLYYIKNRSIALDLGIVLKTITRILKSPGK